MPRKRTFGDGDDYGQPTPAHTAPPPLAALWDVPRLFLVCEECPAHASNLCNCDAWLCRTHCSQHAQRGHADLIPLWQTL